MCFCEHVVGLGNVNLSAKYKSLLCLDLVEADVNCIFASIFTSPVTSSHLGPDIVTVQLIVAAQWLTETERALTKQPH